MENQQAEENLDEYWLAQAGPYLRTKMCYHIENNQKCPYSPCWDAHTELELRKPDDKLSEEEIELAKVISKTLNVDNLSTMSSGQDFDFNKECEDSDTENFLAEALDDPCLLYTSDAADE